MMMDKKDDHSMVDFNWWIGVVEDNQDPTKLMRCKVRIFGLHTEKLDLLPTEDLPWASPMCPATAGGSKSSSYFKEGDYVCGYFLDGPNAQAPVIIGSMPGAPQTPQKQGTGFSAEAKYYRNPIPKSEIPQPISNALEPAVIQATIENGVNTIIKKVTAPAMLINRIGFPTIPATTYNVAGTTIQIANEQTVHSCDFKFLINFGNLNLDVIENPITIIKNAIAQAKNKAATLIQAAIQKIIDAFRLVTKGIIITMNLDPSGEIAKAYSKLKDIIRKINYYAKIVAKYVGAAAFVVEFVKQLRQIVEYIKSLPQRIVAMLKDCLSTFLGGINDAINSVKIIPQTIAASLTDVFQNLADTTQTVINEFQEAANTSSNNEIALPNNFITYITSPSTANTQELINYYATVYPNTNVVISQYTVESFNVANSTSP